MLALADPTKEASDVLREHGTSAEELQAAIDEGGLLGALELLREHGFVGNSQAMSDLIEDNRALVGATALLEDQSGSLNGILDATANSTGAAGDAFAAVAETDAFKMQQALAELQVAMIEIGSSLSCRSPPRSAQAIADLASFFSDLPGPVQGAVVAFAGLAATVGPLIFIAGTLVRNFMAIRAAMQVMSGPAIAAAGALGLIAAAVTAGIALYQIFTAEQRQTEKNTKAATAALDGQFNSLIGTAIAAARAGQEIDAVAIANEALSMSVAAGNEQLADSAAILNISAEDILDVFAMMEAGGGDLTATLDFLARSFGLTAEQAAFFANNYDMLAGPANQFSEGIREQGAALGITSEQFDVLTGATRRFLDASDEQSIQKITADFLNARVEASGYEDSLVEAAEAQTGLNRNIEGEAIGVYRAYAEIVANASDEQLEAAGVTEEVQAAIAELAPTLDETGQGFADMAIEASDAADMITAAWDDIKRNLATGGTTSTEQWAWIDNFGASLQTVIGLQREYTNTADAVWESALSFGEAIDDNSRSLEQNSLEGLNNRSVLGDWLADIQAHTQAQLDSGMSVADATESYKFNRQAMIDAAVAAGFEEQEVLALIDALGGADGDWEAAIHISGEEIAMEKIRLLLLEMDEVDAGVIAEVNAILETEGAWAALAALQRGINATEGTVEVHVRYPRISMTRTPSGMISIGNAGYITAQHGAYIGNVPQSGQPALLHSDEVVLPLGNASRMAALLGLPEVGPRVRPRRCRPGRHQVAAARVAVRCRRSTSTTTDVT